MKTEAVRIAFTRSLLEQAKQNARLFALATDSRGSVTLGDFARELPSQFVECGIAEQDAVGIAAGLANAGIRPFVCGPACFLSLRSAEQVKIDIAYSHQNVKVIGVSGGVSYGALGATHHATQDIALMRSIPGIEVFLPCDGAQMAELTEYLAQSDEPAYVRMGRGAVPVVYEKEEFARMPFRPGKANKLINGGDAAIIACGEMVHPSLEAAKLLKVKNPVNVSVYDMHTLRPLDEGAILEAADTGFVMTVEEHNVHGGLGAAVAEVLCQQRPTRMKILGFPDETLFNGTSAEVFDYYGLTAEGIAGEVRKGLGR